MTPTTVRGKVYDENGATVNDAKVTVRSLSAANPFSSTVDAIAGSYVVNNVPAGVQLEIVATRTGWTSRARVETLLPLTSSQSNVVNFGGPASDQEDPEGLPYFISKYPEVVSAVANRNGGAKLTYVIKLSEPLDDVNRRRFENAFSISAPNPNGGFVTLRKSSTFLDDRIRATTAWDETGTTLTYTFEAPLLAKNTDKTTYVLTLARGTSDELIQDAEGNVLGLIAPNPDQTYSEAFKLSAPLAASTETAQARWAAAHTGSASFEVPEDDDKPTLVSVTGSPIATGGQDKFRFALTFSEPMRVYPQESGFSASVTVPTNYFFAMSEESLDGVDMERTPGSVSNSTEANAAVDSANVFQFATSTVEFSNADPKVVYVTVDRTLVPDTARFFKVRVEAVQDPASNVISTANKVDTTRTADNIKSGAI